MRQGWRLRRRRIAQGCHRDFSDVEHTFSWGNGVSVCGAGPIYCIWRMTPPRQSVLCVAELSIAGLPSKNRKGQECGAELQNQPSNRELLWVSWQMRSVQAKRSAQAAWRNWVVQALYEQIAQFAHCVAPSGSSTFSPARRVTRFMFTRFACSKKTTATQHTHTHTHTTAAIVF